MDDSQVVEPSSFRDPSGRVFYHEGRVLRALGDVAAADWKQLSETRFLAEMMSDGRIIGTTEVPAAGFDKNAFPGIDATVVLEHDRIPFISYPYEWTFGMLRAAAITHLEVLLAALDEGFTMKDGYSFNVQFRGSAPVFIDIGSFEPIGDGGPWVGYRQFCQTMLYPLMVEAYLGIPFQGMLRGQLEGIDTADMRRMMGAAGVRHKGVLRHVVIHDMLSSRVNDTSSQATREQLANDGAGTQIAKASASKLLSLVRSLSSPRSESVWAAYRNTCSYSDEDTEAKTEFIEGVLSSMKPSSVFDLGCNDGRFSQQASRHADHVMAADFDALVVDNFYRDMRRSATPTNVLPLVQDLTDPSPARGWRGRERSAFFDRAKPDLVLALALVHHLSIGANVPLAEAVDLLTSLGGDLVIEFVEPHDPMAEKLLSNKPPGTHDDYQLENFERILSERSEIHTSIALPGESRRLYHVTPRDGGDDR
ncbi:MAG: methyltransferase [Microthrixaceae bacterium]